MLFKIGTLAILALSFGEIGALPSDSALDRVQLTERELSPIMERGLNYVCKSGNDFARCQQAKATLQARELRGCDVWKCIVEGSAFIAACLAAVDEGGVNPLADVACAAALMVYTRDCEHCLAGTCRVSVRNSANSNVGSTCVDAGSSGSIQNRQSGRTVTFTVGPFCGVNPVGGLGRDESLSHEGSC